jgi:hypothetical protein
MPISLSIAQGSPFGGQAVTITGTGFGATAGSVTFDGRTATPVSWSATSVVVKTPARAIDGVLVVGSDDVVVTLTPAVGAPQTGTYHYNATRWDLILHNIKTAIAQISVDRGDYFTIGPSQILGLKLGGPDDTGEAYPQGAVYRSMIEYSDDGRDSPYGFDTGVMTCVAQFVIPLGDPRDWDFAMGALGADLYRAIRLARNSDGIGLDIAVKRVYPGPAEGPMDGALGSASVEFDVNLKHINTNMNSNTQGE